MKKIVHYLIIGIILAVIACSFVRRNRYCYAPVDCDRNNENQICIIERVALSFLNTKPEYIISDETLYLYVESMSSMYVIPSTTIEMVRWDVSMLEEFRKENPQLEEYWPDRSVKTGGVGWIRDDEENNDGSVDFPGSVIRDQGQPLEIELNENKQESEAGAE